MASTRPHYASGLAVTLRHFVPRRSRVLIVGVPVVTLLAVSFAAYLTAPMDTAHYLDVKASDEMLDRDGKRLHAFLNEDDQWCFPLSYADYSPKLIQATVAVEDQRFWMHPGVDPLAIVRAGWGNLTGRGAYSGASTVTMQVVKLTDATPRSLLGKVGQMATALRLDWHADKEAILRAYLNRAPYGLNLVGAEAASRRYFGKSAAELSLPEAALLAGLPKAPGALLPLRHEAKALARRNHVLARMGNEGFLDEVALADARKRPLGAAWHGFPQRAPHLAMQWHGEATRDRTRPLVPKGPDETIAALGHRSTLDRDLQTHVEDLLPRYLKRFDGEITNGAVMVVHVPTAEVLVRVGSVDFFDTPGGGQVDLCRAPRSPGSTLKPFTYGLAMERQTLYPTEKLLDDALDYGGYNPGNFDGQFNGLIPAADALRYSLNVPAVTVLERVGAEAMQAFLKEGGLTTLTQSAAYYGLGLTLGNCEARLDEMMAAYCAVANLGVYRALRYRLDQPDPPGRVWLSRGTAIALYAMLEQPFPEEAESGLARSRGEPARVAWKTGTSTGLHDAWSFAFNAQYLVGVWLGNNEGTSSTRLVGSHAALPLAARVFHLLPPTTAAAWPAPGDDWREAKVCVVSGLPAHRHCPHVKTAQMPRRQYLHRHCDVHSAGGVTRWPGTARGYDLAAVKDPVTLDHEDQAIALKILAPPHGAEYVMTGADGGDRIHAKASLDGDLPLHWYLDSAYLGTCPAHTRQWIDLEPGKHTLVCLAPSGETDVVEFKVLAR